MMPAPEHEGRRKGLGTSRPGAASGLSPALLLPGLGPWAELALLLLGTAGIVWLVVHVLGRRRIARELRVLEDLLRVHGASVEEVRKGRVLPGASPLPRVARQLRELVGRLDEDARSARADVLGLELAYARLQDVLFSLAEGVIVVDSFGEIVITNAAAQRFLKLDGLAIGTSFSECIPEAERQRVLALLESVKDSGRIDRLPAVEIGAVTCELSISPLRSVHQEEEGPLPRELQGGAVLLFHDVTEAVQAQKMKDEFLSSVSHELRTPLTSIRSYAEILLHMTPEDEQTWKEFLGIVNIEAERLTRLVNDVLDLAKMEAGEMEFSFEPLEVETLLTTIRAVFDPILEAERIAVSVDCPEHLPPCLADHDRLHQVLTNLVGNAVKFAPGGGHIRVSVRREEQTAQLHFCIEDDGPGVSEENRERVFEKFKQVGDAMTEKPKGTGLGLPLCRQMLNAMGGEIWCTESEELGGAAFHFRLPITADAPRSW